MSTQLVHFPAVLAIPVGHEVEVRIFEVEEGIFSKSRVVKSGDPLLIDRTTGVMYGSDWHFKEVNMYRSGEVIPDLPTNVRSDLRVNAVIAGRVRGCRVAWIGSGDSRYPQTTLAIEMGGVRAG